LSKAIEKSQVNSANAKRRHSDRTADAQRSDTQSQSERKKDAAPAAIADPEVELFRKGREVLGKQAGGLISQLLKAKQGSVAHARAAIEVASTKSDPREYIGAVIRGPKATAQPNWIDGIEGVL
jgi:hypothetical protein